MGFFTMLLFPVMGPAVADAKGTMNRLSYWFVAVISCIFSVAGTVGLSISVNTLLRLSGLGDIPFILKAPLCLCATGYVNLLLYAVVLASEYPRLLSDEFSAAGRSVVSDWLDGILGHKVWAGNNTYQLIETMRSLPGEVRGKWFLVNFLAEVMDDNVRRSGATCSVQTSTPWTDYRYSQFLATNMDHASDSIWWVVDPDDLFGTLLPEMAQYVLSCAALGQYHEPEVDDLSLVSGGTIGDVFRHVPPEVRAKACAGCGLSDSSEIAFAGLGAEEQRNVFRTRLLPFMAGLGAQAISAGFEVTEHDAQYWYDHFLVHRFLKTVLPHTEAFRRSSVPSKQRLLYLGELAIISDPEILYARVKERWDKHKGIRDKYGADVWIEAIKLFLHTCGEKRSFSVAAWREARGWGEKSVDGGIHDRQFVVESHVAENGGREVTWWFYGHGAENPLMELFEENPRIARADHDQFLCACRRVLQ